MDSTPSPKPTEPVDVLVAPADERLARTHEEIKRVDEQITHVQEQLAKLEHDAAPNLRMISSPPGARFALLSRATGPPVTGRC